MGRRAISNTFCVNTIEDGKRGKVGRFYYFGGVFDSTNRSDRFKITDAQAPFFEHTESGQKRYHVYNPEKNPTTVNSDMSMYEMWQATQSWNNAPWVAMTNDFKFLISEALFSDFAHLGGAIINGTWMLSQHGTINGSASSDYEEFDPDHPNENYGGSNFVPNYCVDLLTGATYQQNAYVEGSIYTSSIGTKFREILFSGNASLYVGLDENNSYQPSNDGIWNFKLTPQNENSRINIILPTNRYAHIGQRVIIFHTGYGTGGGQEATISAHSVADNGTTGPDHQLGGLSIVAHSSTEPLPINSFEPVGGISFVNGVIELMCVPAYDTDEDLCDWCVVNLGTNFYTLWEL